MKFAIVCLAHAQPRRTEMVAEKVEATFDIAELFVQSEGLALVYPETCTRYVIEFSAHWETLVALISLYRSRHTAVEFAIKWSRVITPSA